jgi:hypothetical protein
MNNETVTARNRPRRCLVAAVVVIMLISAMGKIATPIARAQAANPVFDVVSIKPATVPNVSQEVVKEGRPKLSRRVQLLR